MADIMSAKKRVLLVWGGPVFADTPDKVHWPDNVSVDKIVVSGNGSDWFSNAAEQWRGADGRILANLAAANGKNLADYQMVALAGFSAFHGLAAKILDVDSDKVDAVVLLDSCFSAMGHPAKAGYTKFAQKAARGGGLMVATYGPGGGPGSGATLGFPGAQDFSSGTDCVMESVKPAGALHKDKVADGLPEGDDGYVLQNGGLTVIPWKRFQHQAHINTYGVPVMQAYLAPYLASGGGGAAKWLLGAVAACLGWLAYDALLPTHQLKPTAYPPPHLPLSRPDAHPQVPVLGGWVVRDRVGLPPDRGLTRIAHGPYLIEGA